MGIFDRKISIKRALRAIYEHCNNHSSQDEHIIFLRATDKDKNNSKDFQMEEGSIIGSLKMLPRMLVESARGDEFFAKCLITAAESLKHNMPELRAFSDKITSSKLDPTSDITQAIRDKFPGAEVMSIDITKLDDMPKEEFDKVIDKLFKASKNNGQRPDQK